MELKEIKLIRLSLQLNHEGFKIIKYSWIGKKTKDNYIVKLESELGYSDTTSRRVSKKSILVPENITYKPYDNIIFSTWVFPEDVEKGLEILKPRLLEYTNKIKNEFDKITKHI